MDRSWQSTQSSPGSNFDKLLDRDPLRGISRYVTTPLTPLHQDREADQARYNDHRARFFNGKSQEARAEFERYRALFDGPPDYVGKYAYKAPPNPRTDWTRRYKAGDPLEVLLLGVNPLEYITQWDDARKLIHHEKVMWWHDYTAMLIDRGKISHAWGTNEFCFVDGLEGNQRV
jgi:hypothetical protein